MKLDQILLRFFLPRLLARTCGETIHRSGSEAMKTNCFSTTIRKGEEPYLVLLSMQGSKRGLKAPLLAALEVSTIA